MGFNLTLNIIKACFVVLDNSELKTICSKIASSPIDGQYFLSPENTQKLKMIIKNQRGNTQFSVQQIVKDIFFDPRLNKN